MGIGFFIIIVVLFFSCTALAITCMRWWHGTWRWLAALPAAALVSMILNIVIGILLDSTSHNLWPLEIVLWSAGGLVYLGVLSLMRKIIVNEQ